MSNQIKHTSSLSNRTKQAASWANSSMEHASSLLLEEDDTEILQENGDAILLESGNIIIYNNQAKH